MADFKNKVVYQIYTKSFRDSNGDGLGDLRGVIEKLDYLHDLGVDYLWLTPFFKSPLNDNGYDISDYLSIDPVFGTMADVEELIAQADRRGMGLMFDMVFNHTSTEHEWFQRALAGEKKYQDYYIFQDGPRVHEYLKELVADAGIGDMVTVGEMSSTSLDNCIRYTDPAEKELSMTFSFHHLKVDYKDGNKWELQAPDLEKLKELLTTWQLEMQTAGGWNAVFWCNHDQPRAVSRFGDDRRYWKGSAKMLATCIHLLRGTPYIFQGEELGITNAGYTSISQYRDVESLNYYQIMLQSGKTEAEALEILRQRSRDNGRTPMQWDAGENAGFSSGTPWIIPPENYRTINVEAELRDPDSILHYYQWLIQLRKENLVISEGKIEFLCRDVPGVFAYRRFLDKDEVLVYNNLTGETTALDDVCLAARGQKVIGNYADTEVQDGRLILRPYESIVCRS